MSPFSGLLTAILAWQLNKGIIIIIIIIIIILVCLIIQPRSHLNNTLNRQSEEARRKKSTNTFLARSNGTRLSVLSTSFQMI